MNKYILYILLISLLLVSCEEQTDWNLQNANNDFVVVDGIITNELKVQTITLTRPVSKINEKAQFQYFLWCNTVNPEGNEYY